MDAEIAKIYGNRVRVRICGLCWSDDRLLMVNHKGITATNFWAPPGGGLEFGQSMTACLTREFEEETGLQVTVRNFQFGCEFIHDPLHAVELFFDTVVLGGELKTGKDPELQIIKEVRFMSADEIRGMGRSELHGIFQITGNLGGLRNLTGFFSI